MHVKIRFRVAISDGPIVLGEFPGLTKTTQRLRSGIIIVCCSRFFCGTMYPFLLDHAIYENLRAQNIVHTSKIRFYVGTQLPQVFQCFRQALCVIKLSTNQQVVVVSQFRKHFYHVVVFFLIGAKSHKVGFYTNN